MIRFQVEVHGFFKFTELNAYFFLASVSILELKKLFPVFVIIFLLGEFITLPLTDTYALDAHFFST